MEILKWVRIKDIDIAIYSYKFYRRMYLIDRVSDNLFRLYIMYLGDSVSEIKRMERKTKKELIFLAKLDCKIMDFNIRDREALDELYSS